MISVADGERFGQGELKGDVFALEVAHGAIGLEKRPLAKFSLIPRRLSIRKVMRCVLNQERIHGFAVQVNGGTSTEPFD
jgi:hypothetical protein